MGKGVLCITLVSAIPQVKISSPVVLTRCTQSIFTRELVAREGPGGGGGSAGQSGYCRGQLVQSPSNKHEQHVTSWSALSRLIEFLHSAKIYSFL